MKSATWTHRTWIGAALTFLVPGLMFAGPKMSQDLHGLDPNATVNVIIQFHNTPTERHHKKIMDRGGVLKASLETISGGAYSLPARELEALSNDPEVAYISPDRPVHAALDYAEPAVNANIALQYGWDGSGIAVAVIDSGISNHPDLKNSSGALRVVYSQDFVGGGTDDHYGHGGHVAGIIGGNGASSSDSSSFYTVRGVAPNVNLVNLRVLDAYGSGTDSSVIAAINQAIALKAKYNIRVINLSLGRPVFESYRVDPLCQAVEQAWKAGIVVVVAAGNNGRNNSLLTHGYGTITAPGNDPYAITVGAMKTMGTLSRGDDLIASYSSKGPTLLDHVVKPDIVAPGNRMTSLLMSTASLPSLFPQNKILLTAYMTTGSSAFSNMYFNLSGTSMATPMVSGAAALMLQRDPTLTPDTVKARLMKTATKNFPAFSTATDPVTGQTFTSQYDIFTIGAGYLDIWAALNNYEVVESDETALSPTAIYDPVARTVTVVNGTSLVWGDSVWSTAIVWGSSVFLNGTAIVWGDSVVWGSALDPGFAIVWGDAIVWGSSNQTSSENMSVAIYGEN